MKYLKFDRNIRAGDFLKAVQAGFQPLLYGIVVALLLTVFLRETGPASRKA
jgi:hypothetical protein